MNADVVEVESEESPSRGWRDVVFAWLTLGFAAVAVATLVGFAARWNGFAELFVHFKVVYFCAMIVTAMGYAIIGRWRWVAAPVFVLGVHAPGVVVLYVPSSVVSIGDTAPNLTLLVANILSDNTNYEEVLSYIREREPDVILIQEVSPEWMEALRPLLEEQYPHALFDARFDNFGMAVLSRLSTEHIERIDPLGFEIPIMETLFKINGREVSVLNYHTLPPVSREYIEKRNRQLAYIGDYVAQNEDLVIVSGDMNVTPWSPVYRDALADADLVNTRQGFGVMPTWPARGLMIPVVPIDHCLVSPEIVVTHMERGPRWGSDHRALWVELYIPESVSDAREKSFND